MRRILLSLLALALVGCGPSPKPDSAIVLWEQPLPQIAALSHAWEIKGFAGEVMSGSMFPLMAVGDWVVADTSFPYEKLKAGDITVQQARFRPADAPWVAHYCADRLGDEWIMKGLANVEYERDVFNRMGRAEYRGKIVQVYTKRAK